MGLEICRFEERKALRKDSAESDKNINFVKMFIQNNREITDFACFDYALQNLDDGSGDWQLGRAKYTSERLHWQIADARGCVITVPLGF